MLVVFANNQVILAPASGQTIITTDPVAIGDNSQACGTTNVHKVANITDLQWKMQVSNDGETWVYDGPVSAVINAAGQTASAITAICAVYARLEITFNANSGGLGWAIFDVHMNFNRS